MKNHNLVLVLAVGSFLFVGCQTTQLYHYSAADVSSFRNKRISSITLKNGDIETFNESGGIYLEQRQDSSSVEKIVGNTPDARTLEFELTKVLEVDCRVQKTDPAGTLLTVFGLGTTLLYVTLLLLFSQGSWN